MTSTKQLGRLPEGIQPLNQIIPKLKQEKSVELFLSNSGSINPDELFELIIEDREFPIKKIMPGMGERLALPISYEDKNKLLKKISHSYET